MDLETLFEQFLPMFEEVYRYIVAFGDQWYDSDNVQWMDEFDLPKPLPEYYEPDLSLNLRERELKVVVQIVDDDLDEKGPFDDIWNIEGMIHETSTLSCCLSWEVSTFRTDIDNCIANVSFYFSNMLMSFDCVQTCEHNQNPTLPIIS